MENPLLLGTAVITPCAEMHYNGYKPGCKPLVLGRVDKKNLVIAFFLVFTLFLDSTVIIFGFYRVFRIFLLLCLGDRLLQQW